MLSISIPSERLEENWVIKNDRPVTWESCPDCGRVVNIDQACPDCQEEEAIRVTSAAGDWLLERLPQTTGQQRSIEEAVI